MVQFKFDTDTKQLQSIQTSYTKGTPAAVVQVNSQYYACASNAEIEFFDLSSGMCVHSIQILPHAENIDRYTSFAVNT